MTDFQEDIYIAAKQVSQYVNGTRYMTVGEEYTYIDYDGKEMTFFYDHHRLVKKPGFEIILSEIDDLSFEINHEQIYMNVERDHTSFKFLLTYAQEFERDLENEIE